MKKAWVIILSLLAAYGVARWARTHAETPAWFRAYITDLLCMPLLLMLSVVFMRMMWWPHLLLDLKKVMAAWLYVSILFEMILPSLSDRYTADTWDVVVYAIGCMFFIRIQAALFGKTATQDS